MNEYRIQFIIESDDSPCKITNILGGFVAWPKKKNLVNFFTKFQ